MKSSTADPPALKAALEFADDRGWYVFPMRFVKSEDGKVVKRPLTKWGSKGGVTNYDLDKIRRWWKKWPDAGVGIACGPSELIVIDVDGEDGTHSLARLEESLGALPKTLTALTSRGRHLYFDAPLGAPTTAGSLGTGIDTRGSGGAGGYVIAPPSHNPFTNTNYRWADENAGLAPLPQAWASALAAAKGSSHSPTSGARPHTVHKPPKDYATDALNDELRQLSEAEKGTRNDRLNEAAFNIGRYVGGGYLKRRRVVDELTRAALSIGLSDGETQATIVSGLGDGAKKPWVLEYEPIEDRVLSDVRALMLADRDDAEDHMDDLHDDEAVLELPDPEFVIDGWVPRGLYSMLYGEPGVGKTFALLGMARAVRRGTRWQDHKTARGAVLFYQGEGLAQLKPRIRAWDDRYRLRSDQSMAPGASLERTVDVTRAEGVAAIARTVRRFERERDCEVQMVVIDPLVEFMTGDENGDGMTEATKGLRALAGYLDIAVVVGHHTNASGERARGADFHRMRAGSFMRMEPRGEDTVGILQEKQKNAEELALVLDAVEHGDSLVLEWVENVTAADYRRAKDEAVKGRKRDEKTAVSWSKRHEALALLTEVIRDGQFAKPGDRSNNKVLARAKDLADNRKLDVGRPVLKETLGLMVDPHVHGLVRVEQGANTSALHYWIGDDDA